jgi:hypothetical protein
MTILNKNGAEKIISIKEVEKDNKDGFEIITNQQTIFVGIENMQCCCEDWGYITSNDDLDEFIDAELLEILLVDEGLNTKVIDEINKLYECSAMFVNFNTSKGTLQLTMYNSHNGYYSHKAVVVSKMLNYDEYL